MEEDALDTTIDLLQNIMKDFGRDTGTNKGRVPFFRKATTSVTFATFNADTRMLNYNGSGKRRPIGYAKSSQHDHTQKQRKRKRKSSTKTTSPCVSGRPDKRQKRC